MNKEIKKIFLVLALYAMSGGVFYNFQELWMADNNLSTKTIGIVFSLCALLSVSVIFLCSNIIDKKKIKNFACILLFLKIVILFALFLLNHTGLNIIIKFLIMLDYVIDVEIYALIYPMITFVTKNDKLYALRGLIYSYAYYGGILFTSFLLNKTLFIFNITFNTYCLIGSILMLISYIIMKSTDLNKYCKDEEVKNENGAFNNVLKIVKKDKISQYYLGYLLMGDISYNSLNALLITLLTTSISFSASGASTFKLVLGIVAVLIGTLILEKLTFKKDEINFSIKYIGRLIVYLLAVIFNNGVSFLIAIIFIRLLTESYSHVTDAPYINRYSSDNQLAFCNLREMVSYLGKSIGTLFCGFALTLGIRYNFIIAIIFLILQIICWFNSLRLRKLENKEVNL